MDEFYFPGFFVDASPRARPVAPGAPRPSFLDPADRFAAGPFLFGCSTLLAAGPMDADMVLAELDFLELAMA